MPPKVKQNQRKYDDVTSERGGMPSKLKNKLAATATLPVAEVQHGEEANANAAAANANTTVANLGDVDASEEEVSNNMILRELREYRQEIKHEFAKTNSRLDEAEKRIVGNEEKLQDMETVVEEMLQLQEQLQEKLMDQECRSRRENIRLYGIPEQKETSPRLMIAFVEKLLRENLDIPATEDLLIERAHRALAPLSSPGARPRSIVVKFQSFKTKEEVIRLAWQKKGFVLDGQKISIDHDYAPEILHKRKAYAEARRVLKENQIRFQTLYPARLRVHYTEGQTVYDTAEEATADMASRGLPVKVIEQPTTLRERIQRGAWQLVRNKRSTTAQKTRNFKQKLQVFRREQTEDTG